MRIIQDYVPLKKKGKDWMACCPFHKEKTASFAVVPAKELFYCFGCHKGGSVFNFVMEMERVSFPEAIKMVEVLTGGASDRIEQRCSGLPERAKELLAELEAKKRADAPRPLLIAAE